METPFITHAPISRESEPNCTASPDFWVTNSATSGGICVFKFRGAFTDLFSEKQDAPTTGAESQAVVQAVIPCVKNSPKETRLQPDVWWLSSHIVSFISMPRLSSSILSPPNCLCSRPVIISPLTNISISSFCLPCHYYSPLPALISLLSHSQFTMPSLSAMHFQFSLIFPPFLSLVSHLHPIHLPILIFFPFPFNSVQAGTSPQPGLSGIWRLGGNKPCALRSGTAIPGKVLYIPALEHPLGRCIIRGANKKAQISM